MTVGAGRTAAEVCWRLPELANLHWRRWGDEWTVFDSGSSQTHLMDALAALAVTALELGPCTIGQLAQRIHDEPPAPSVAGFEQAIEDALRCLAAADLIEPVVP